MKKGKKDKEQTPMEKLTGGYERFIKGKGIKTQDGKKFFDTGHYKKAVKPKQRELINNKVEHFPALLKPVAYT